MRYVKNIIYTILIILSTMVGSSLFLKFLELKAFDFITIDGDGIGIYWMMLEFDHVPNEEITTYAYSFLAAAIVFLGITLYLGFKLIYSIKKDDTAYLN
jgi:hypothetical protein